MASSNVPAFSTTRTGNAKQHVKVYIRTRPTSDFAQENLKISTDQKSITVHMKRSDDGGFINNQQDQWHFVVDGIFHNASQDGVYDDCVSPITQGLLNGYNGTILAYGQTGSGKTFSMTGATENYKHRGIIPRAIAQVFHLISEKPELAVTVRMSYLEIYNESIVDLLSSLGEEEVPTSNNNNNEGNSLAVVDDKQTGSSTVKGLSILVANNEEEALNLLFEGENNRSIAEHELNKRSSRSHCICTIYVESRSRVESSEKVVYAKLNLVDLAGSERLSKTNSGGATLKEAMYINRSLTYLEQVILALADRKRDHVPYRQSKLTNVLRDSLGGNCQTIMIGNIRCEKAHLEETISTLRFAMRMMCVVTNPVQNVQNDPTALVKKYERIIKELKQELSMHDTLSNRSHIQYEPFSENQRAELLKTLKAYLDGQEEEIEIVSLRQIKEYFAQFRNLYRSIESELEERIKSRGNEKTDEKTSDFSAKDNSNSKANALALDNNDESAVGDLEGMGFGVGLAPMNAKPSGGGAANSSSVKPGKAGAAANAAAAGKDKRIKGKGGASTANDTEDEGGEGGIGMINQLATNQGGQIGQGNNGALGQGPLTPVGNNSNTPGTKSTNNANSNINAMNDIVQNVQNVNSLSRLQSPIANGNRIPSRAEEFEKFKHEQGADLFRNLNENKGILREKKSSVKALAEQVNTFKVKIDSIKESLGKLENSPPQLEDINELKQNGATRLINEEQYQFLLELKETKSKYKRAYDGWKSSRAEMEYCERIVGQCRERFLAEFEQWYEDTYGSLISAATANQNANSNGGNNNNSLNSNGINFSNINGSYENSYQATSGQQGNSLHAATEDVMDIGEKFEKLHLERVSNEDPNSVPFYNALRQQERKLVRGIRKGGGGMTAGNQRQIPAGQGGTFQV